MISHCEGLDGTKLKTNINCHFHNIQSSDEISVTWSMTLCVCVADSILG